MPAPENSKAKKVSPYFSFCKQRREEVKARLKDANQPISAAALAKALSELWRSLSDVEKQKYNQQSIESAVSAAEASDLAPEASENLQTRKFASFVAANQSPGRDHSSAAGKVETKETESGALPSESKEVDESAEIKEVDTDGAVDRSADRLSEENVLAFPLARVKRIIKLDREIRVVTADASILIAHATQLFLEHFASIAYGAVLKRKRKTVCLEDLKAGVKCEHRIHDFLGDVLDDIFATEKQDAGDESGSDDGDEETEVSAPANQKATASKKRNVAKKPNPVPPLGTRYIADFFGNKSNLSELNGSEAAPI